MGAGESGAALRRVAQPCRDASRWCHISMMIRSASFIMGRCDAAMPPAPFEPRLSAPCAWWLMPSCATGMHARRLANANTALVAEPSNEATPDINDAQSGLELQDGSPHGLLRVSWAAWPPRCTVPLLVRRGDQTDMRAPPQPPSCTGLGHGPVPLQGIHRLPAQGTGARARGVRAIGWRARPRWGRA